MTYINPRDNQKHKHIVVKTMVGEDVYQYVQQVCTEERITEAELVTQLLVDFYESSRLENVCDK